MPDKMNTIKICLGFWPLIFFACSKTSNKGNENAVGWKPVGVHSAFYNGSGDRCAISLTNGYILLADSSLRVLEVRRAHQTGAHSSFFSLDDRYIVSGGADKYIRIWDSNTLYPVKQRRVDFAPYTSVMGYSYFGACGEKGNVYFESFSDSQTVVRNMLDTLGAFHLFFNTDSSVVISSGFSAYEFDIKNNKVLHVYGGHKAPVYCVMPNVAETRYVTASGDSMVRVFDRQTTRLLGKSAPLDGAVYVACFNPASTYIAASTTQGSIYFLDAKTLKVRNKITAFSGIINTIHYSPDGKHMLAGSEGGGAKIFDVETAKELYVLKTGY